MRHTTMRVIIGTTIAATLIALVVPASASAQWRRPYPGPYPYGFRVELTGSVRVQVTPREAEVFVDGYRAGIVDEYDGFFQRLRLPAGGHQLTIHREGFRTVMRDVYIAPGGDLHIKLSMEALAPGEVAEPPPSPDEVVIPEQPSTAGKAGRPAPPSGDRAGQEAFGALALRVTPADAVIRIDGEAAEVLQGRDGPVIRLAAGEHAVEVAREGYQTFTERVLIQRGRTLTLMVTLVR